MIRQFIKNHWMTSTILMMSMLLLISTLTKSVVFAVNYLHTSIGIVIGGGQIELHYDIFDHEDKFNLKARSGELYRMRVPPPISSGNIIGYAYSHYDFSMTGSIEQDYTISMRFWAIYLIALASLIAKWMCSRRRKASSGFEVKVIDNSGKF